jgi:aminocarboxymuconate-semialdehyde decarboxylase
MCETYDLHAHLLPEEAARSPYSRVRFQDEEMYLAHDAGEIFLGFAHSKVTDASIMVAKMDAIGLDKRAVAPAPLAFRYDLTIDDATEWHQLVNDTMAGTCETFPDRLLPLAVVPLQHPEAAAAELRRAVTKLGMPGAQLGTEIAGGNLDSPALEPFWDEVEALGVPLFIHTGAVPFDRCTNYYLVNLVGIPTETAVAVATLLFGGVLDRHPALRFWLAHGGGAIPALVGRWRHGWTVRSEPKAAGAGYPGHYLQTHFWYDSLTHDREVLRQLARLFGLDRIVVGSDAPFDMGDDDPLRSLELAFPDKGDRDVIHEAARALLMSRPKPRSALGDDRPVVATGA